MTRIEFSIEGGLIAKSLAISSTAFKLVDLDNNSWRSRICIAVANIV